MLSFLDPYLLYVRIAGLVVLATFAAWALRVNHLRNEYHDHLDHVAAEFKKAGLPNSQFGQLADNVTILASDRDAARQDLATANSRIDNQNERIAILGQATAAANAKSEAAQRKADAAVADRNTWIAQAQINSQRMAVGTDTQEKQECDDAMTSLFRRGF